MIYIVECILDIQPDQASADPRPGWVRRMFGPFPDFESAHTWMTASVKDWHTLIIHPLDDPNETPAA